MSAYTNMEAWTFIRNLVASDRLDELPFDKAPFGGLKGNPFLDASLTHSEAKAIDGARMFATIASVALENDSVAAAFEPLLDKAGLMDVVFAADEHERIVRELATERMAAEAASEVVYSVGTPDRRYADNGKDVPGAPYKKREFDDRPSSPVRVIDFRSQLPTGVLGWIGTLGGAAVTLALGWDKNDDTKKIAEIILPEPIDGFETLESILKRQGLGSAGISEISLDFFPWMLKYYAAYVYKFEGKLLAMALTSIVAIFSFMIEMSNTALVSDLMMLFAYNSDKATRGQVDKSLVEIMNTCGYSEEASTAHNALVKVVATNTRRWVAQRATEGGLFTVHEDYETAVNQMMGKMGKQDDWTPNLNSMGEFSQFAQESLASKGSMPKLMGMIPNLYTSENVKEWINTALGDAYSGKTEAQRIMIGFASTAREFGKGADYCVKEAAKSSVEAINIAARVSNAADDLRPSAENPSGTGTYIVAGVLVTFLVGAVWNATSKRAKAHEEMIKAYGLFLMNRSKSGMTNLSDVAEKLRRCIILLTITKGHDPNGMGTAWLNDVNQYENVINQYAQKRQHDVDAASDGNKIKEYKHIIKDCKTAVEKLVETQEDVDTQIRSYLQSRGVTIDTSKSLCDQLRTPHRAGRSPARTQPGRQRPARSPGRRQPNTGSDPSPFQSIDEIVDRFKASRLGRSGTGP